jgi:hypothetical protein
MLYYLVANKLSNNKYNFMYGSNNLDSILLYINKYKFKDLIILEYHLQGDETYIGVNNGLFRISYKSIDIITSYLEKENKLINIHNEIDNIDFFHTHKNMDINTITLREELLIKEEKLEEEIENYGKLFECYGFISNNLLDNYKFSVINYFK